MIDRKQMALPATGGDRDRDLARECVLWKEIEEHFEQPAVCRTVDRCADHYDSGVQDGLNRIGHFPIFAATEQGVGRQLGEVDESSRAGALPLQRCERQLEQRTRARDRFRAAGQAYNRCGHCFFLQKRSAATRIEESRPITVRRFGAGARVVYLILSRMPTRLTVRSPYNTWSSKRGNTSAWGLGSIHAKPRRAWRLLQPCHTP